MFSRYSSRCFSCLNIFTVMKNPSVLKSWQDKQQCWAYCHSMGHKNFTMWTYRKLCNWIPSLFISHMGYFLKSLASPFTRPSGQRKFSLPSEFGHNLHTCHNLPQMLLMTLDVDLCTQGLLYEALVLKLTVNFSWVYMFTCFLNYIGGMILFFYFHDYKYL